MARHRVILELEPWTGDVASRGVWRSISIVSVKVIHSVIFLINSAAIAHIFWAGLRDQSSRWTPPALGVAFAEVAVFVANRGRCPLTSFLENLGAESGRVSDIFLPRWFADRIPRLCTPLLLAGVVGLLYHARRHVADGTNRG